jgi:hypothetical protein
MIRAAILSLATTATAAADTVTHGFCWRGAEGYRIEGTISYPASARGIVTQDDVTGFAIAGWRGDALLGRWTLDMLTPETSWRLTFNADRLEFPMGGYIEDGTYQEWNANGFADDCGVPGFGFNGGNRAQDVCVDGTFVNESGVPPDTPLRISPDAADPCGPLPMSGLPAVRRHG